ncbi:MAG: carboxypeptidase M32 [Planctomycetota bacterium]|jgi:carboxypeptidase Taq
MSAENAYRDLAAYLRQTAVLQTCRQLLSWDRDTHMPRGGAELRAEQIAMIMGLLHRRRTAPELGALLEQAAPLAAGADPDAPVAANVREARRDYDRATRVPVELVEERARTFTLAREAWVEARAQDDFASFRPWLEKNIALARRYAEALGPADRLYDALLEDYEPGATTEHVAASFAPLREALVGLLDRIRGAGDVATDVLYGSFPAEAQASFATRVAQEMGFDFERGRLDTTVHPFCVGLGSGDVRLTTRWDESCLVDGFFSVLHEAGHGLYEQGFRAADFGLPSAYASSFGVHESQSRMWENFVGRSRGFWQHFWPLAQELFPDLEDVPADAFHLALNAVAPTFIRVDADEVNYNLHIFLRFELEQVLLSGDLAAKDLPDAWSESFAASFGVRPPDDRQGCLQDVHWSSGLFGYFATYTLGNLYAAQLFAQAEAELGDLDAAFGRGEFVPLLSWFRERVHAHGRRYRPRRLIETVTGAPPSHEPLVRHLETKYSAIYGL